MVRILGLHVVLTFELLVKLLEDLPDGSDIEFHELQDFNDLLPNARHVLQ